MFTNSQGFSMHSSPSRSASGFLPGFAALALGALASHAAAPAGMALIASKGESFTMGMATSEYRSGDPWAHYENAHKVSFTYDYYMDTAGVTQGDYKALTGRTPSKHVNGDMKLPVEQVSYYDAILYFNAKSKQEGLDTAYVYKTVTKGGTGSASAMTGLVFNLKSAGYRIPTNAEYEYAERGGAKGVYFFALEEKEADRVGPQYVWWSGNSGNETHPVGTKKPNGYGLYDLVGNLFEWCNDFDAAYPTTDEVDPVGAATGNARIAKGGSFRNDITGHMRIKYHYKWDANSNHWEVGFRGARTVTGTSGIGSAARGLAPLPLRPGYFLGNGVVGKVNLGRDRVFDIGGRLAWGADRKILILPVRE
jgi:formylglycine-generating enzyme required for sulfatase activity